MKKNHQLRSRELAMQVYRITSAHAMRHPDFLMSDVVPAIVDRYETSRATAFRYVRAAVDVMGIAYVDSASRRRQRDKH